MWFIQSTNIKSCLENVGFVYDNSSETIICTKVKKNYFIQNERMYGKDDGIC